MAKDGGKSSLRPCLRALWLGRAMLLTRAVASVSAAALLGALALAVVWTWSAATRGIEHSTLILRTSGGLPVFITPGTTLPASMPTVTYKFHRVELRQETIVMAVAVAIAAWIVLLLRIWGPPRRTMLIQTSASRGWHLWLMPVLVSLTVVLAIWAGTNDLNASDFSGGDKRYIGITMLMAGGGLLLTSWLGVIEQMLILANPFLDADGQINIRCPGCGYLLIGLRELRCPECGMQFTIDELIRAQPYAPKIS